MADPTPLTQRLRAYNKWRRGSGDSSDFDLIGSSTQIGLDVDEAIATIESDTQLLCDLYDEFVCRTHSDMCGSLIERLEKRLDLR